jgi:hypothetical protein
MIEKLASKRLLLAVIVIILGLNIGVYWSRALLSTSHETSETVASERNERSTPRSFILPATPAVAYEQELRAAKDSKLEATEHQLAMCATKLSDRGYDVGDEAVAFNAKLAEAIYDFQRSHDLQGTGRLDTPTISKLACKVKR